MNISSLIYTRKFIVSTAIEKLKCILTEEQSIPKTHLEKMNFVPEYLSTKFKEFLSPDSDNYRCDINPVFSLEFELSTEKFLNQVSVFSLRDGVLGLLRFFAVNPTYDKKFPLLIVDASLSALVPESWRSHVVLRENYVVSRTRERSQKQKQKQKHNVLLCFSADPFNLPMDVLQKELLKLKEHLSEQDELMLFFSSMRMRGEGEAYYDTAWGYKTLLTVQACFPDKKIDVIAYNDLKKMNVTDLNFHFVNPLQYYFTDTFLYHDLIQRGAWPLLAQNLADQNCTLKVSLNHGYFFHQNFSPYIGEKHERVLNTIFKPVGTYTPGTQFKAIKTRLYPKDFMDWSYDVALELYLKCQ